MPQKCYIREAARKHSCKPLANIEMDTKSNMTRVFYIILFALILTSCGKKCVSKKAPGVYVGTTYITGDTTYTIDSYNHN